MHAQAMLWSQHAAQTVSQLGCSKCPQMRAAFAMVQLSSSR